MYGRELGMIITFYVVPLRSKIFACVRLLLQIVAIASIVVVLLHLLGWN